MTARQPAPVSPVVREHARQLVRRTLTGWPCPPLPVMPLAHGPALLRRRVIEARCDLAMLTSRGGVA